MHGNLGKHQRQSLPTRSLRRTFFRWHRNGSLRHTDKVSALPCKCWPDADNRCRFHSNSRQPGSFLVLGKVGGCDIEGTYDVGMVRRALHHESLGQSLLHVQVRLHTAQGSSALKAAITKARQSGLVLEWVVSRSCK